MKKKFKQRKKHWFLFSYKFKNKNGSDGYGSRTASKNTMNIPVSNFSKLVDWVKNDNENIKDVLITSVSYLGRMTEKEFNDDK